MTEECKFIADFLGCEYEIFENEEISICGITEAELIHGAKSEKEINLIITLLSGVLVAKIFVPTAL